MPDFADFQIEFERGDTAFLDFAVTTNKLPQNVSGWLIWLTAKRRPTDSDPQAVFQKSTALGGVTVSNAGQGLGFVTLQPADTASLAEERLSLFADLQAKDGAGQIFTLAKGRINVRADITQSTS